MRRIAASAPDLAELKPADKGQLSVVYAADGSRLGFIQSDVLRRVVPWRDIPVNLRRATVAIEDERFYEHGGVDLNAIVRAGIKNLESGKTVQGGSTITQQLVKQVYLSDATTLNRKINEAYLAWQMEHRFTKEQILTKYLNTVYFGNGAYGVHPGHRAAHAKGVLCAATFIATPEARATDEYKQAITEGGAADIVTSALFTGVSGNYLRKSSVAAGLDPENLPAPGPDAMSFQSASGAKAWRDIWGSGQGIGIVDKVVPAADLIGRLSKEYAEAKARICAQ